MNNYNNNTLNNKNQFDLLRKERLNFNQDGIQVASVETSIETKQIKGRRMGTLAIHAEIPYSIIIKTEEDKSIPMLNYPINTMIGNIRNWNISLNLQKFILTQTNEFLNIQVEEGLRTKLMNYFSVSSKIADKTISEMKKANFIRKHNNKIWSFNPFAVFRTTLSVYKLYELQVHWELSTEPKTSWAEIDDKLVFKSIEDSIDRAKQVVKDKINVIELSKNDYKIIQDNKLLVIKTLKSFWKHAKVDSKYKTLTEYIKTEKGIRHIRNWWKQEDAKVFNILFQKTSLDLEFNYRKRNEYRKLFITLIEEHKQTKDIK